MVEFTKEQLNRCAELFVENMELTFTKSDFYIQATQKLKKLFAKDQLRLTSFQDNLPVFQRVEDKSSILGKYELLINCDKAKSRNYMAEVLRTVHAVCESEKKALEIYVDMNEDIGEIKDILRAANRSGRTRKSTYIRGQRKEKTLPEYTKAYHMND